MSDEINFWPRRKIHLVIARRFCAPVVISTRGDPRFARLFKIYSDPFSTVVKFIYRRVPIARRDRY